jgi:nicotinamidase/pyrazinamidase
MSNSFHKVVFFDVDTQFDFMMPGGKLYAAGAEKLIPNIGRLMNFAREHRIPVISSADAHVPDDPEFRQFPPHCVKGTPGQAKLALTLLPGRRTIAPEGEPLPPPEEIARHPQWIVEKRALDVFSNPSAAPLVKCLAARRYVVFGVATDYCVKLAALGLLRLGCRVSVVTDAIQGIDPAASKAALQEMQDAGAELVETKAVLAQATSG